MDQHEVSIGRRVESCRETDSAPATGVVVSADGERITVAWDDGTTEVEAAWWLCPEGTAAADAQARADYATELEDRRRMDRMRASVRAHDEYLRTR